MRNIAFFALALCCASCDLKMPDPPAEGPDCEDITADGAFLTFNTAEGWSMIPYVGIRTPLVVEALQSARYDVACLQEVWHDEIRDAVVGGIGLPPEQVFFADTVDLGETGDDTCAAEDLGPLHACADAKCGNLPEPREAGICAREQCGNDILKLYKDGNESCLRCLGAMAGKTIAEAHAACTSTGASRIHGGRNGIMLLSRTWRLYNKEVLPLPASSANKVALLATVKVPVTPDGETIDVEVACTHISASNAIPPSHSGYKSWEDEKRAQAKRITERLEERSKSRDGAPMVFMGDLNTGPDGKFGVTATSIKVWKDVEAAGFESPAAGDEGTPCSSCPDNTLGGSDTHLLDHVAFKNAKDSVVSLVPVCSDRQFDEKKTVTGYDGKEMETNISDHYGIRVMFDATAK